MPEHQNTDLLEEVCRATRMGLEAAKAIEPKIKDQSLLREVQKQERNYQKLEAEAERMLGEKGAHPGAAEPVKKAMLWGAVQWNTMMDSTTEHIAELMINGTTMGIIDMTKKLNDHPEADAGARRLVQEYLHSEEQHIDALKKLL